MDHSYPWIVRSLLSQTFMLQTGKFVMSPVQIQEKSISEMNLKRDGGDKVDMERHMNLYCSIVVYPCSHFFDDGAAPRRVHNRRQRALQNSRACQSAKIKPEKNFSKLTQMKMHKYIQWAKFNPRISLKHLFWQMTIYFWKFIFSSSRFLLHFWNNFFSAQFG